MDRTNSPERTRPSSGASAEPWDPSLSKTSPTANILIAGQRLERGTAAVRSRPCKSGRVRVADLGLCCDVPVVDLVLPVGERIHDLSRTRLLSHFLLHTQSATSGVIR